MNAVRTLSIGLALAVAVVAFGMAAHAQVVGDDDHNLSEELNFDGAEVGGTRWEIGQAFDATSGTWLPTNTCFKQGQGSTFAVENARPLNKLLVHDVKLDFAYSYKRLEELMGLSIYASANYGGASGSASLRQHRTSMTEGTSLFGALNVAAVGLANPNKLKASDLDTGRVGAAGTAGFFAQCGTHFVAEIHYGVRLRFLVVTDSLSTAESESVWTEGHAHYAGVTGGAGVDAAAEKFRKYVTESKTAHFVLHQDGGAEVCGATAAITAGRAKDVRFVNGKVTGDAQPSDTSSFLGKMLTLDGLTDGAARMEAARQCASLLVAEVAAGRAEMYPVKYKLVPYSGPKGLATNVPAKTAEIEFVQQMLRIYSYARGAADAFDAARYYHEHFEPKPEDAADQSWQKKAAALREMAEDARKAAYDCQNDLTAKAKAARCKLTADRGADWIAEDKTTKKISPVDGRKVLADITTGRHPWKNVSLATLYGYLGLDGYNPPNPLGTVKRGEKATISLRGSYQGDYWYPQGDRMNALSHWCNVGYSDQRACYVRKVVKAGGGPKEVWPPERWSGKSPVIEANEGDVEVSLIVRYPRHDHEGNKNQIQPAAEPHCVSEGGRVVRKYTVQPSAALRLVKPGVPADAAENWAGEYAQVDSCAK